MRNIVRAAGAKHPGPSPYPYSPEFVEGRFWELRGHGEVPRLEAFGHEAVLRRALLVHLRRPFARLRS